MLRLLDAPSDLTTLLPSQTALRVVAAEVVAVDVVDVVVLSVEDAEADEDVVALVEVSNSNPQTVSLC